LPRPPQPDPNHIYSVPEKVEYEISFPIVTGYHQSSSLDVAIDWSLVTKVTIDPMRIPQVVELTPLTTPTARLQPMALARSLSYPSGNGALSFVISRSLFESLARFVCAGKLTTVQWQCPFISFFLELSSPPRGFWRKS